MFKLWITCLCIIANCNLAIAAVYIQELRYTINNPSDHSIICTADHGDFRTTIPAHSRSQIYYGRPGVMSCHPHFDPNQTSFNINDLKLQLLHQSQLLQTGPASYSYSDN